MNFEIQTGRVSIKAIGDNAVIIRKSGKKVKIPSSETEMKLIADAQKSGNFDKTIKFQEDYPAVLSGDTIISGEDTLISVDTSYNKGKDKPVDDPTFSSSKMITLWPNSEMKIGEVESWERVEAKTKKKFSGAKFSEVELVKGTFNCLYSNDEEKIVTSLAEITFGGAGGSAIIDLYNGSLYCNPMVSESTLFKKGGVEFLNKNTKKTYVVKSGLNEVIVTPDAIYRRPFHKMDQFFLTYSFAVTMKPEMLVNSVALTPSLPTAASLKGMGDIFKQGMGALEMYKNMTPEDLERLASMGGAKVTKEQKDMMKQLPEMTKMMEKEGLLEKMKEAGQIASGFAEGLGEEGMASMERFQKKNAPKMEAIKNESFDMFKKAGKTPRNYSPLLPDQKVA